MYASKEPQIAVRLIANRKTGLKLWSKRKGTKIPPKNKPKKKKIKQKEGLLLVLLQGRIIKIKFNKVNIGIYWILCNDSATRNNVLKTICLNVGDLKQIIWYYLPPSYQYMYRVFHETVDYVTMKLSTSGIKPSWKWRFYFQAKQPHIHVCAAQVLLWHTLWFQRDMAERPTKK